MPKKILIIDDTDSCNILRQQLSPYGYTLITANEGGDQGILLAVSESPDLILIGTDLPILSGWRAVKILKASTATQNIPIIAMIFPKLPSDWRMASESECDTYTLKPVAINHLLGKIEGLLDHSVVSVGVSTEPIIQFTAVTNSYPSKPQATASAPLVVYVEDSATDSRTMASIVTKVNFRYENIAESLHALPQLLELKPQLICLDLVMPVANGYELCAQLRRTSTFKKIPIIIVTSNDGIVDRVRAKLLGASGFMSKPIREDRVLKMLRKYLPPHRSVSTQNPNSPLNFGPLY